MKKNPNKIDWQARYDVVMEQVHILNQAFEREKELFTELQKHSSHQREEIKRLVALAENLELQLRQVKRRPIRVGPKRRKKPIDNSRPFIRRADCCL